MSENYKSRNPEGLFFITLTIINWVDIFTRPRYKHIIIDSLNYCQNEKGLRIHAYVLMSNHLHLIASTVDSSLLSEIVRDFKRYTSRRIIESIKNFPESRKFWLLKNFEQAAQEIKRNSLFKVWKDGFHPIELTNNAMIEQRLDYIHNNPVVQEIVIRAEDYKYSSASNYANLPGILSISKI